MKRPFLNREPSPSELELLKKFLASYRDGSGNNREVDGSTRADSRQIERCFAELLHGRTTENKAFYDFVVESNESGAIAVRGASIKSKEIKKLADFGGSKRSDVSLRAHLEISNSSAKDWRLCNERGLTTKDWQEKKHPDLFGSAILNRQKLEREVSEKNYIDQNSDSSRSFVQKDCVFISVLYSPMEARDRLWMVSIFPVALPPPSSWVFKGSSIAGTDEHGETIYEWYALSGSQFKYYPRISDRILGTDLFTLPKPAIETLRAKASRLFGD